MLKKQFEIFLSLFAAGAKGINTKINKEDIDVQYVLSTAKKQGVLEIVFSEIQKMFPDIDGKNYFFNNVVHAIQRNAFMLHIVSELERNGITCCILKGVTVARFYKEPDLRISGDIDIYISSQHIKKCSDILENNNFKVERLGKMYHFEAVHPRWGLIEVHIDLHHSSSQTLLFDNEKVEEPYTKFLYNGKEYNMLGINDGIFYLFAHFVKHFVGNGAGIRQIMDVLLYVEHYYDTIEWDMFNRKLDKLKLKKLFYELLGIGVKYFGFEFKEYSNEMSDKILDDVEQGGLFGFEAADRKDFFDVFAARRTTMNKKDFEYFMSRNRKEAFLTRLFPPQKIMIRCGYLYTKNKLLLPVGWIHRLFKLFIEALCGKKNFKGMIMYKTVEKRNKTIDDRIELMSKLEII